MKTIFSHSAMFDIILLRQDATLSPAMFMLCPLEAGASRLWFINLWNLQLGKDGECRYLFGKT